MTVDNQITEILNSAADDKERHLKLHALAVSRRDADDVEGFEQVKAEIARHPSPRRPEEMDQFRASQAFRRMYDGEAKALVVKEKHGTRYINITAPDHFAWACLMLVRDRLREGYYASYALSPVDDSGDAMVEAYIAKLLADPMESLDGLSGLSLHHAIRRQPLYALAEAAQVSAPRIAGVLKGLLDAEPIQQDAVAVVMRVIRDRYNGIYDGGLRKMTEGVDLTGAAAYVRSVLDIPDEEKARAMLKMAHEGQDRKAGRVAYEFLRERSGAEYEEVDIEILEEPFLSLSPADFADVAA